MITPRRTRLIRVPDLASFRQTLIDFVAPLTALEARDAFVLVPTSAAIEQLRRTCEERLLATRSTIVLPILGTRAELYGELAARASNAPRVLSGFEREVLIAGAARHIGNEGIVPPFQVRPGLIAEMLDLYDHVRRLGRTVDHFERNLREELERDATDRGAAKLLQQTSFLVAVYRTYEARLAAERAGDEHTLRDGLVAAEITKPLRHVVLTVADRTSDAFGLWPADFDLLTRLPGLEMLDLVCTEGMLASGLLERLYATLPELQEERRAARESRIAPLLVTPPTTSPGWDPPAAYVYRDREEELSAIARRVKAECRTRHAPSLQRIALIVQRPLPYLYVARDVFASAGIPFETLDTLPLAAEPYAAAVDLALDAVASDFTRMSVLALLRSPHFVFGPPEVVTTQAIGALDFALAEARYLGGLERLEALAAAWSTIDTPASREERRQKIAAPAMIAILTALRSLAPLAGERPLIDQIETLSSWLDTFDRPAARADPRASRRLRVRAAVVGAFSALAGAYQRFDATACGDVHALSAAIRRWLGAQTFAIFTGEPGVQIVDAQAARYGDFDDVQLVGLIEGEWPARLRRNVLYPSSLLSLLEPLPASGDPSARERHALNSARAAFKDLLHLASTHVRLSTFLLENDAVVESSILLDDVEAAGLRREHAAEPCVRVFQHEALAFEPRVIAGLPESVAAWAAARLDPDARQESRFQGEAGAWILPRVSVSRLERYLDCPFRFFASEVLRLEEQPEDEDTRTPLERGRFLHELFERFFSEWQKRGHRRVRPESLAEARALFETIGEQALSTLSPAEAALERVRLLGSAISPGIAHRVFAMEAERPTEITERLLEAPLRGDFEFRARDGRTRVVTLSAKADRIDLLADGTLRVVDYKSKRTPELKQALQLPIYSLCARRTLEQTRGGSWPVSEAAYLSFEGDRAVVPLRMRGRTIEDLIDDAQQRLITALESIGAGHFPARPLKRSLCGPCPYSVVCRLDYVEENAAGAEGAMGAEGASGAEGND